MILLSGGDFLVGEGGAVALLHQHELAVDHHAIAFDPFADFR